MLVFFFYHLSSQDRLFCWNFVREKNLFYLVEWFLIGDGSGLSPLKIKEWGEGKKGVVIGEGP